MSYDENTSCQKDGILEIQYVYFKEEFDHLKADHKGNRLSIIACFAEYLM